MKKSTWRIIYNIVVVCAWVTLAIVVGKWWIALFSGLFLMMSGIEIKTKYYYRTCDKCGKHSDYSHKSPSDAIKISKEQGWVHIDDGDRDYCPDCWEEMK